MAPLTFPTAFESPHLQTSIIRFRTILVPVDFSAPAEHALDAAIQIAELEDAEILLVHASYPSTYYLGEGIVASEFLVQQLDEDRKLAAELISSRPALSKLHVETVVEYADPISMVRQLTKEHAPDLITLGSHGPSKIEQLALGSVAQSVVYALTTPVLIMGPSSSVAENLFRSILLATDLSTSALRAAQYASSLCERFGGSLTLLHVAEQKTSETASKILLEEQTRRELALLVPDKPKISAQVDLQITHGEPAQEILKMAKAVNATLIVLGAKQGGIVADHSPWATLSKVIHAAECGVLVLRGHLDQN